VVDPNALPTDGVPQDPALAQVAAQAPPQGVVV